MFVVLVKSGDLASLALHRHRDGWEIALHIDDTCFLKVPQNPQNDSILIHLPCLKRWVLDDHDRLIPLGKKLPEILLPTLAWLSLANLLPLTTTHVRENEPFFGHLGFTLVAATHHQAPTALRLPFQDFAKWAGTAPAPRLSKLKYALSNSDGALVIGSPLPPLPGPTFYQDQQLLIPSGFTLPDFILAENFTTNPNQLLLIDPDQTVHTINQELLLPATRSSIRTTAQTL